MMSLEEATYSIRTANSSSDRHHTLYLKALFETENGQNILTNFYKEMESIKFQNYSFPNVKKCNAEPCFKFATNNYIIKFYSCAPFFPIRDFLLDQCINIKKGANSSNDPFNLNPLFLRKDNKFLEWIILKIKTSIFYKNTMKGLLLTIDGIKSTEEFKKRLKKARQIVIENVLQKTLYEYRDVVTEEMVVDIIREIQIDLVMEG